ncbi:lmo0937 family membrane protein [Alkalihalobacillus deserti]|nr:lmo0937 family membrane protein [Alkalihalobacillus deserti]
MLWTIILVILAIWLIGAVAGFLGNIIHILLAVALILIIVRLVQGKKVV